MFTLRDETECGSACLKNKVKVMPCLEILNETAKYILRLLETLETPDTARGVSFLCLILIPMEHWLHVEGLVLLDAF